MAKIGRNEPCPCGAKKLDGGFVKYKNCHITKTGELFSVGLKQALQRVSDENSKRRAYLESLGIFIDFVKPVSFQGKKIWALGNRVYPDNPPHQTFHEFITFTVLRNEFGVDWFANEFKKSDVEMHYVAKCAKKYSELSARSRNDQQLQISEHLWHRNADGWTQSLLTLAFDIASLAHSAPKHDGQAKHLRELIKKLKEKESYQSARYEVAVAAIFARLGFLLDYYNDRTTKLKHGEFVAWHPKSNIKLVVEAKSRHRQGVLHKEGSPDNMKNMKGDVRKLFNQALQKETGGLPFIIFIDVNCPASGKETFDECWARDVVRRFELDPAPTAENPDPFSAVVITNFSYHYQAEKDAVSGQSVLIIPLFSKVPIPDPSIPEALRIALQNYGNVPLIEFSPSSPPSSPPS